VIVRVISRRKVGEYGRSQGAYVSDSKKTAGCEATCYWWLRSPGDCSLNAALVYHGGSVITYGRIVLFSDYCVRPALWLDLADL